jgi:hypothetical protein
MRQTHINTSYYPYMVNVKQNETDTHKYVIQENYLFCYGFR